MAGTTQDVKRQYAGGDTELLAVLVTQFNLVIDNLDAICAKLDADTGVNDTDYADEVTAGKLNAI